MRYAVIATGRADCGSRCAKRLLAAAVSLAAGRAGGSTASDRCEKNFNYATGVGYAVTEGSTYSCSI